MKRLYIVVEGQTEQEFVNSVAAPYLNKKGILDARPILIRTSRTGRGGMTKYKHLSDTVRLLLNSDKQDFIVTTFIDYFRLPDSMPVYDKCMEIPDETARIEALEASINDDIGDRRFFAYIQRHEFEALLFSSNAGFKYYFPDQCARQTAEIIASYTSPEDINSSPEGAPSKRLLAIKPDYNKVLEGNVIAIEVGIETMLSKCPRFSKWFEKIITACQESPGGRCP